MTPVDLGAVADAVVRARARIREIAGERDVQLIAVTKGFGPDAIDAAVAAGCDGIGENYAQELLGKLAARGPAAPPARVHFIGHLQSNKVRSLAASVAVWHTLDRDSVIAEVARRAPGAPVFVQVNTTAEATKAGCSPDEVSRLVQRCRADGLVIDGLMTIGPTSGERDATAQAFELLRLLADDNELRGCSMGMSADFEIALEHGATHVRLGSILFGERPVPRAGIG